MMRVSSRIARVMGQSSPLRFEGDATKICPEGCLKSALQSTMSNCPVSRAMARPR